MLSTLLSIPTSLTWYIIPGPLPLFHTGSDEKLGRARERGYHPSSRLVILSWKPVMTSDRLWLIVQSCKKTPIRGASYNSAKEESGCSFKYLCHTTVPMSRHVHSNSVLSTQISKQTHWSHQPSKSSLDSKQTVSMVELVEHDCISYIHLHKATCNNLHWSATQCFVPQIHIALQTVLLKSSRVCCVGYTTGL